MSSPPTIDGKYALGRKLGVGSLGTVYEAEHLGIGNRVAVKVLHPALAANTAARERFIAAARKAARLTHGNIVALFDLGVAGDGTTYLVMEQLDGETLSEMMAERGRLAPAQACELMQQILAGLDAAHAAGTVHGWLDPGDVIITRPRPDRLHATLLDVGIAHAVLDVGALGGSARPSAGTPARHSLAPERLAGAAADVRSDVYAAGALLHELLTGQPPFVAHDVSLPSALDAVLARALSPDPASRPASAAELSAQLAIFVNAALAPTTAPQGAEPSDARRAPPAYVPSGVGAVAIGPTIVVADDVPVVATPQSIRIQGRERDPSVTDSLLAAPRFPKAPGAPRVDSGEPKFEAPVAVRLPRGRGAPPLEMEHDLAGALDDRDLAPSKTSRWALVTMLVALVGFAAGLLVLWLFGAV